MFEAAFPNTGGGVYFPVAGTWNTLGYAGVLSRELATRSWTPTWIWNNTDGSPVQVRSLFSYTDSVTGVDLLFAGTDDQNGNGGIYGATYSATAPGNLVWGSSAELALSATNTTAQYAAAWNGSGTGVTEPSGLVPRVMSFALGSDGNLYATVGGQIWQRQNGTSPSWTLVWTAPKLGTYSQSGLRGLTPYGDYLLVALEGSNFQVYKLNLAEWSSPNYGSPVSEYNLSQLSSGLGSGFTANYVICAYNNMLPLTVGGSYYHLLGLIIQVSKYPTGTEIYEPPTSGDYFTGHAYYLIRNSSGIYTLQRMTQFSGGYDPESCRAMAAITVGSTQYVAATGFDVWVERAPGQSAWVTYDTAANAVA